MGEWRYIFNIYIYIYIYIYIHMFLTSTLVGGVWSTSRPSLFTTEERAPGTHYRGGWVDPSASLDDVVKRKFLNLPALELRPLGRPARSQSLYRLRFPDSQHEVETCWVGGGGNEPQTLLELRHTELFNLLFSNTWHPTFGSRPDDWLQWLSLS
jgi:hypothetical protein